MAEFTLDEFEAAKSRGKARLEGPRAESAHYDAGRNRVVVQLTTGVEIGFGPEQAQGLENAAVEDLKVIEIEELGLGIHFPRLDADLHVPALVEGLLGSKGWMAARLGSVGGRKRSAQKTLASRRNGRQGGRPRKLALGEN
jgi:hypothetical protein